MILQTVLATMMRSIFFRPGPNDIALTDELRRHFRHLYWDIAWFGIVAGSSQAFLGVYVARLGATPLQMGLLNAGPALMGLIFTMPAGIWLRRQPMGRAVFRAAAITRLQFLLWAILPSVLSAQGQVWSYLGLVLFFTIPATVLAIAFNAMYAAAVPIEHRQQVAATRNAVVSLVFVIASLSSGWLLNTLPLPLGYQIIFAVGCIGAAMSTYHLYQLRNVTTASILEPQKFRSSMGDLATGMAARTNVGLRVFSRGLNLLRVEVLQGSYGKVVTALFAFHFAQFMPIPVFPLFWVDEVHFTDWEIGVGTAVFHAALLLGSLQFVRFAKRFNNRQWSAIGALLLSFYPLMMAFSHNIPALVLTSILGGLAWSVTAATLGNYLLEQAPEGDRPAYLAWYNLALNAAVLLGSLSGSFMAETLGIVPALLLAAALRAASGYALWKWY